MDLPRGVRPAPNGSWILPKKDIELERILDANPQLIRMRRELRWFPKTENNIEKVFGKYKGKVASIIGKGPSLDQLSVADFPDSVEVIIAINESIHKVESLDLPNPTFAIQQDASLRGTCRPKRATLLIGNQVQGYYDNYPKTMIYYPQQFNLGPTSITANIAINVAKEMGVCGFRMLCFDACVNQNCGYAECIGYSPDVIAVRTRFLGHCDNMKKHLVGYPVEWVTPEAPMPEQTPMPDYE